MMKILLATTNPGKLAEISAMLDLDIDWVLLSDFPDVKEIIEDGETFAENARKKALGYAKQTGLWTLADDSGLVVDALDGAPGVNSARFSSPVSPANTLAGSEPKNRTLLDHKNMAKLLDLLKDVPKEKRTVRFICCLCLACPEPPVLSEIEGVEEASPARPEQSRRGKVLIETEGKLEGIIAEKEAGSNGFGYDPLFFLPDLNKTVAQLSAKEKNSISHRGNALRNFTQLFQSLIQNQKP